MYSDVGNPLYEIRKRQKLSFRDHLMLFMSYFNSTWIFLKQEQYENAHKMMVVLDGATRDIIAADGNEPNYQRYRADAQAMGASILAKLNRKVEALVKLSSSIDIYAELHKKLPSKARRLAWLESLTNGVQSLQAWDLKDAPKLAEWKSLLREKVGDEISEKVMSFWPPDVLPVWLRKITLAGWPTTSISSPTLRYSLYLPSRWKSEFSVQATNVET
jgi:hypothetical protein